MDSNKSTKKREKNKKGVSNIVLTVIIVAISLVAITIVWAVVSNLISSENEIANVANDCLQVNFILKSACYDLESREVNIGLENKGKNNPKKIKIVLDLEKEGEKISAGWMVYPGNYSNLKIVGTGYGVPLNIPSEYQIKTYSIYLDEQEEFKNLNGYTPKTARVVPMISDSKECSISPDLKIEIC